MIIYLLSNQIYMLMENISKKSVFIVGVVMSILGFFSSCSTDDLESTRQAQVSENVVLKSGLSLEAFSELSDRIDAKFGQTRSSDNLLTEQEAKDLLLPVLEDGKKIRDNMLNTLDENSADYFAYSILSDEELIVLSMLAASNEPYMSTRALSDLTSDQVVNCIGSALGIPSGINGLKLSGLISAKTGLQVLKAVAKRYAFGYVSLAISVYQFGDCVNDVAHVI